MDRAGVPAGALYSLDAKHYIAGSGPDFGTMGWRVLNHVQSPDPKARRLWKNLVKTPGKRHPS